VWYSVKKTQGQLYLYIYLYLYLYLYFYFITLHSVQGEENQEKFDEEGEYETEGITTVPRRS
jgi:hypothetical protein